VAGVADLGLYRRVAHTRSIAAFAYSISGECGSSTRGLWSVLDSHAGGVEHGSIDSYSKLGIYFTFALQLMANVHWEDAVLYTSPTWEQTMEVLARMATAGGHQDTSSSSSRCSVYLQVNNTSIRR
jgi:hypothetical protein